jgi:uncharacterized protein YkwD
MRRFQNKVGRSSGVLSRFAPLLLVLLALILVVMLALPAAGGAASSYSQEELAFLTLINQYRQTNGLGPLLLSDMVSDASAKHDLDMGKYKFFDHITKASDYYAVGATPWDRMAASGYTYNTYLGENIAAGYATAAAVFQAWKNSSGHNANMLNSNYKVIGIALRVVSGSPYGSYWTTDFGGYVDPTAHNPGTSTTSTSSTTTTTGSTTTTTAQNPGVTRYEQTDTHLVYQGSWSTYSSSSYSGRSMRLTRASGASVTVSFTGTKLDWITMKGATSGKARVTVDGGTPILVDLYSRTTLLKQVVWTTGTLSQAAHTVKIEWTGQKNASASSTYVGIDALDVTGVLR